MRLFGSSIEEYHHIQDMLDQGAGPRRVDFCFEHAVAVHTVRAVPRPTAHGFSGRSYRSAPPSLSLATVQQGSVIYDEGRAHVIPTRCAVASRGEK
jgi:hypothetical protein